MTTAIDLFVRLLLTTLMLYAITWLVRHSYGPGDVFLKLRKAAGIVYMVELNDEGIPVDIVEDHVPHDRSISKLFGCFWCLVTWLSIPVSVFVNYELGVRWVFVLAAASIGLAGLIYSK